MDELLHKGVLDEEDRIFLKNSIGKSTIEKSLEEIDEYFICKVTQKYSNYLFTNHVNSNSFRPVLKPDRKQTILKINQLYLSHKKFFDFLHKKSIYEYKQGDKILEIGYITGGHSIFAFEKMGFTAMGIDNFYSGLISDIPLHQYITQLLNSKALFLKGDITEKTPIEAESLDCVHSISVLEHIMNLPDMMKECFRILKPGGLMIHRYDPYFHPKGGHSLGMLDSAWGHLRLSESEYARYLFWFRPNEADLALDWYHKGIHRDYPIQKMQLLIVNSGFDICYWHSSFISKSERTLLSSQINKDALENYPEISINDLLYSGHLFVARKPRRQN
ncbi:hypothetical protein OLK001_13140 [Synechocystis sp. LKSZ1]